MAELSLLSYPTFLPMSILPPFPSNRVSDDTEEAVSSLSVETSSVIPPACPSPADDAFIPALSERESAGAAI